MTVSEKIFRVILPLILGIGLFGWLMWVALRRSDDPRNLIFKWIWTAITCVPLFALVRYLQRAVDQGVNYAVAFFGGTCAVALGLVLAIIWRQSIASLIANSIGSLYDGGREEVEPAPVYSIAKARRARGRYREAITEIRGQLEKFPNDLEGQMLLAEIQAENMNDLPGAELTVQRLINQPDHPPRGIAYALNSLADWYLKYNQDRDAAKQHLQTIIERFPDSDLSSLAAQRIAHLAGPGHLIGVHDRKKFTVVEGVQDIGLLDPKFHPKPPEEKPSAQAADLVKHLEEHPLDTEAREHLAVLYADHYQRLDLASDQLEQLIADPNQPPRRTAHWLNLLADLQIRHSANYETVKETLQRIVDLFPNVAAGQVARNRLDHLKSEFKAQEKGREVKLGTYEQDIGLKMKPKED